ncbi:MAG: ATP-grasp domain-containing protein, partial [Leptospirales bacterium]
MNIHEYQAKELFKEFGIPVPNGVLVETVEQARQLIASSSIFNGESKSSVWAFMAQILAGGRGKAGGV